MKITHYECDICKKRIEEMLPGIYRQSVFIQNASLLGTGLKLEIAVDTRIIEKRGAKNNIHLCKKCLTDILSKDL